MEEAVEMVESAQMVEMVEMVEAVETVEKEEDRNRTGRKSSPHRRGAATTATRLAGRKQ